MAEVTKSSKTWQKSFLRKERKNWREKTTSVQNLDLIKAKKNPVRGRIKILMTKRAVSRKIVMN